MSTHRPGSGGLFDSSALCGFSLSDGPLRMHEYDYDCPECKRLSGEHVDEPRSAESTAEGAPSFPSRGADDAPDEPKGDSRTNATPAPPTTLADEDREALAEALPMSMGSIGFRWSPQMWKDRNTAAECLTGYGEAVIDALSPVIARLMTEARAAALSEAADDVESRNSQHYGGCTCLVCVSFIEAARIVRDLAATSPP